MASGDPLWIQGWDLGDVTKEAGSTSTTGGTVTATATNKQTGDYCLRLNRTGAGACHFSQFTNSTPTGNEIWPAGVRQAAGCFSLYVASLPSSATDLPIFYVTHFSANDATLTLNSSGQLKLQVVGQSISATIATLSAGNRYLIEWQDDSTATAHVFKARVNGGTEQVSNTGTDGANDINGLQFGAAHATASTWDLYIDDAVVVEGTTYPGDLRVAVVRPDIGASDIEATWSITGGVTPRANAVDEAPPDDATTYLTSSTSGQAQRIPMADTTIPGTPLYVGCRVRAGSNSATGTRNFTANIRNGTGGTDGASTTISYDVNGWVKAHHLTPLKDVPGGSGWTQTDVNNAVVRLVKDANTNAVRVTTVFLTVAYSGGVVDSAGVGGAIGQGVSPTARVAATAAGAVGGGPDQAARVGVATGGAIGDGVAPAARVAVGVGGAVAGGFSPTEPVVEAAGVGGAQAGGVDASARVVVEAGGAAGDGVAPSARVAVEVGGALAGGAEPSARASVEQGGAVASDGPEPGVRVAVGQGAAIAGGVSPTAPTIEDAGRGGAVAGGVEPAVIVEVEAGGATGAGIEPSAAAAVEAAGAIAGGVDLGVVVDVAAGGAAGAGVEPSARVDVGRAAATAGGVEPGEAASESPTPAGAVAGGVELGARVAVEAAGAVAGGTEPGEVIEGEGTGVGGAVAGGVEPGARVDVSTGGATAGGVEPGEVLSETPATGGALAAGVAFGVRVEVAQAGAVAAGTDPGETIEGEGAGRGGAVGGGVEPSAAAATDRGMSLAAGVEVPGVTVALDRAGATAGGVAPGEVIDNVEVAGRGGALAGGVVLGVRVAVGQGGAVAGGVPAGEGESETPGRGGAVGGGVSPTAWVASGTGSAAGGGRAVGVACALDRGGAGVGASLATIATVGVGVGGALAGGPRITEPDEGLHVAGGGVPRLGVDTVGVV